jgi:osmotically-inducible protein OsmY
VGPAENARKVSVKRVVNDLQVMTRAKVKARGEDIETEVKKALEKSDFKDVSVEVKNGVVRMKGTVPTWVAATGRSSAGALSQGPKGRHHTTSSVSIQRTYG